MRFAAIDFETASGTRTSACALGLAVVENGGIAFRREWLIRPPSLCFSPASVDVHGITPEMVVDAPRFDELWPEVERAIGDRALVAHNSGFDMPVLQAVLAHYEIWSVKMPFLCSCSLARRAWPEMESHSLAALADEFGIVFRHHHAGEDAMVAAQIVLHAAEQFETSSLEDFAASARLRMGEVSPGKYVACRSIAKKRVSKKLVYVPELD